MNAQQLEYVRIQLRAALVDDSGGTKGQLEAFAEHPPAEKNLNPRKMIHVVELDNGRGGVRRVKAENSALYVLETRSRRRPMPPMKDGAFSSCEWRRAVLLLPKQQQAWIRYCYGFDLKYSLQVTICEYVWNSFQDYHVKRPLQSRIIKDMIRLVWISVQDVAAKRKNETYKEYAGSALANMINVSRQTWSKSRAKKWENLKLVSERLDKAAIKAVWENYRSLMLDDTQD
ncbi:bacteriophage antitermination protein Q [Klebsiella sp. HN106]|uniref:bacteriophage antitermination protein Q n=1 Tax=Klebsiella sp. HN106 TaxID=3401058 RepID=UPI003EB9FC12